MRLGRKDLQRLLAVFGFQDAITLTLQVIRQYHQYQRFVLDDENDILCIFTHGEAYVRVCFAAITTMTCDRGCV